ncbi:MAG TPA: 2-dehydropantoate 2-reductase [Nitrospira sp.]|nr:2-dehydropantoate 2-reductase [Nitrospira sp.]
MEQIMIVGAGSVGGFFGAHLAKSNPNVSFLLRPKTLAAVREQGLTVRSASGTFTVHPPASSDPKELPQPDLVILAVKAYDLDEVLGLLEPVLGIHTVILTLQNGIDTEDRILARLGRDCVIGGVAFIYSKITAPGVIEHYKKGTVAIGELMGHESERLLRIRDFFTAAGIPCQLSKDIRRSKWEKMCWNCVFNPITVVIDDKVAKALEHHEMLDTIRQIVGEVAAVAAAMKVPLPADMAERVLKWTQEIRDIHTSMYDDWKAGRPTEIDYLNGYIAKHGNALGIPTPVNQALTAMIRTLTERDQAGVRLTGAVVQPVSLSREAMTQLSNEHQLEDIGRLTPNMRGRAVAVKGLLEVPALGIGADHVTFHSADGRYAATLTLQQARDHAWLVYEVDGGPLPVEKGGPFRLIAPGLGDACANVKGVGVIEIRIGSGKDTRPSAEQRTHC